MQARKAGLVKALQMTCGHFGIKAELFLVLFEASAFT